MSDKKTFDDFNLHPDVVRSIRDMRYETPTPIQEQAIPPIMEGRDLIGNAQTGTGKTAAFLIPILHRLAGKELGKTRVLILVPTRELATQIDDNALGLSYYSGVKTAPVYGGAGFDVQERALRAGTAIIIATPGRLIDHFKYGNFQFDAVEILVLDEADRMLDMGFWPDIELIINKLPKQRQTLLFSATMPEPIMRFAKKLMTDPIHIKVGEQVPPSRISQTFYPVPEGLKEKLLSHLLKGVAMESVIVFVQTKVGCERLFRKLEREGFSVGVIHGDREQEHRNQTLTDFKHGTVKILVATDVAARGIDVEGVSHVVNFGIPHDPETYIHRIGRTARAEAVGDAFTLYEPAEEEYARQIEAVIGKPIPRKIEPGYEARPGDEHRRPHDAHRRGGHGRGPARDRGHGPHQRSPMHRQHGPQGAHGQRDHSHPRGPRPHTRPAHAPTHGASHAAPHTPAHGADSSPVAPIVPGDAPDAATLDLSQGTPAPVQPAGTQEHGRPHGQPHGPRGPHDRPRGPRRSRRGGRGHRPPGSGHGPGRGPAAGHTPAAPGHAPRPAGQGPGHGSGPRHGHGPRRDSHRPRGPRRDSHHRGPSHSSRESKEGPRVQGGDDLLDIHRFDRDDGPGRIIREF